MRRLITIVVLLSALLATVAGADTGPFADEATEASTVAPERSPMAEAMRSFVLPGWSQNRQGHSDQGALHTAFAVAFAPFALGIWDLPVFEGEFQNTLGILLYLLVASLSAIDAYELAVDSNRENGWDLSSQSFGLREESGPVRIVLFEFEF